MIVYTSKRDRIVLGDKPFASGGEGSIYKALSSSTHLHNVCVKVYHPHIVNQERERRIKYMALNPPERIRDEGFLLGWPLDYVTDQAGRFLGFVMPLGFPGSKELVTLTSTQMSRKLDNQWYDRYNRDLGERARIRRLKLICNIAIPVHILHATGKYVLKDLKPQNVMATADGRIVMVDMDSIQIAEFGKVLFAGTAATPEYMPPEFYSEGLGKKATDVISPSWDTFSLGIIFYQLLFGIHPYVVTPKKLRDDSANNISQNIALGLFPFGAKKNQIKVRPPLHDKFLSLPQEFQKLFIRTFSSASYDRPTAEEWGRYIHQVVVDAEQKCDLSVNQAHFCPLCGHEYVDGQDVAFCTWCGNRRLKAYLAPAPGADSVPKGQPLHTVFCPECGSRLSQLDTAFCTQCGTPRIIYPVDEWQQGVN